MKREELIYYSLKYEGDYNKIIEAITNKEKIESFIVPKAITIFDDIYPKEFLELKNPPFVIYYEGDISLLKEEKIGVVGSRKPSEYSLDVCKKLCENNKNVVVSGLAKGIDACAHANSKRTIGILGSGINYYYPLENKHLIDDMKKNNLVLSEYPDKVKPYACHFPFRNRLIAALSKIVYIMETGEHSGTMTTVNEALELGRDIKVLPFEVFTEKGKGNLKLIHEGADIIDTDDIYGLI